MSRQVLQLITTAKTSNSTFKDKQKDNYVKPSLNRNILEESTFFLHVLGDVAMIQGWHCGCYTSNSIVSALKTRSIFLLFGSLQTI